MNHFRISIILLLLILSSCNFPLQSKPPVIENTPSSPIIEREEGSGVPTIEPTLAALQLAVHPPERRTGVDELDRVIDAVLAHDYPALKGLTGYLVTGCAIADGLGGPPRCEEGESEGTIVEAVPFLGPEGHHQRRSEYEEWDGPDVLGLLAVYQTSPEGFDDPSYPAGEYGLLFLLPGGPETVTLQVRDGQIIRYDYSVGGISAEDLEKIAAEVLIPLTFRPVPTAVPWQSITDPEGRFSLLAPPTLDLIEDEMGGGWILGNQIKVEVLPYESSWITCFYRAVGDCPFVESDQVLIVNGHEARRVEGYIGAVGGNIPQEFLVYLFDLGDQALVLSVYALPLDAQVDTPGQIWPLEGMMLELFQRTVETVQLP